MRILVEQTGRVVTQRHLLQQVWGPAHVERTHYLRIIVGRLRQKLGDDPAEPTYIVTEPAAGYLFTGGGGSASRQQGGRNEFLP
ncbi:winged helix-turn-helix domain-containing protein [Halofilum ochraceum]|uniref:winged helix-turn-helix domain-containing protein n=1 Tax=Halofilum ochraceum TaxID=1611323 RepID=UPI0009F2FEFB